MSSWAKDEIIFGLESTAHYGNNLIKFLLAHNFKVALINPLQTSSLRKANIRNTKTDKVDTFLIAKRNLTLLSTRSKIKLHAFIDQCFPELHKFFKSGIHIACCYALLKRFPSPKAVLKVSSDTLSELLSTASRGRYSDVKVLELKECAKTSVGINNSIIEFQIKQTVKHIEFIAEQLDEIDEKINDLFAKVDSPIASIPGIGAYNGSIICGYIGTVSRLVHPRKSSLLQVLIL